MGKIIAFANQKGGVGKTTSAVSIAAALGLKGLRVLLVDIDPQGNASSGVGVIKKDLKASTYGVLVNTCSCKEAVVKTEFEGLSIMPSNISLAGAEFEIIDSDNREGILRTALRTIANDFDYVIIDCPPSLGLLTINSLVACDGVVIPMLCEYYALEGLSQLILTIRQVKKLYNPNIDITGIILTMYNGRLNLSLQVLDELKKYYADRLFNTPVLRNVKLSEAPSYGKPIMYYDKYSKGCQAYIDIASELVERI